MPDVHADPEDIEGFIRELQRFNNEMNSNVSRMQSRMSRLGETWRDGEFQKFESELGKSMRSMHRFVRSCETYIPKLRKKADALRRYQNS